MYTGTTYSRYRLTTEQDCEDYVSLRVDEMGLEAMSQVANDFNDWFLIRLAVADLIASLVYVESYNYSINSWMDRRGER